MHYHLKLKTGFFKKEPIDLEVIADGLILEAENHEKITIKKEEIVHIDIIDSYHNPEIEIHTKNQNYLIYLTDLSQSEEIFRNLSFLSK